MAIQYNFLAPIDQKVRDQGYDFVSRNEYLEDDFKPTSGISYEGDGSPVSYANSGIMTQAPIPGPLKYIPPSNDGSGRDPEGPAPDTGAVTADDYGKGPVGEMGMTEEEQEGVDSVKNAKMSKLGLAKTIGSFAMFGPFAAMIQAYRENKKAKEAAKQAAKDAQTQRDFDREAAKGNKGASFTGGRYDGAGSKDAYDADPTSYSGSSKDGGLIGYGGKSGTPRYQQYLNGGRVGYFFGGRVNYKAGGRVSFKNGGLASIL